MVSVVPEGSGASGSRSERSSGRDPGNSLAENEIVMKNEHIKRHSREARYWNQSSNLERTRVWTGGITHSTRV